MHRDEMGMRRLFSHRARRGDMTPIILKLLAQEPMHGYQIISNLEDKTHGLWKPSPGSVYPTLQLLEEQDFVSSEEKEGKKVYKLTEKGKQEAKRIKQEYMAHWEHGGNIEQYKELRELFFENIALLRKAAANESEDNLAKVKSILADMKSKLTEITKE